MCLQAKRKGTKEKKIELQPSNVNVSRYQIKQEKKLMIKYQIPKGNKPALCCTILQHQKAYKMDQMWH